MAKINQGRSVENKNSMLHECKKHWQLYIMLLLPVVYIIIFSYLPMGGIVIAFKDFSFRKGIFGSPWAGLKYFKQFWENPVFFDTVLKNTIVLSVYSLVAGFFIPIILALALNEVDKEFFKKTVQMVTYAPYFISTTVLVGMLLQILNPNIGLINRIIVALGGKRIDFMSIPSYFPHIYVWSGVWQGAGYNAIIYLATLAGVDQEIVEASIIDGANRLQRVRNIDLPTIAPTIVILLILSIGNIMNVGFEKIYLMQNPVNTEVSEVISTLVYKQGLQMAQMSYASAIGLFNSIINFALLIISNFIANRVTGSGLW